jgi:hypothetical protein
MNEKSPTLLPITIKKWVAFASLFIFVLFPSISFAQFAGGSGTQGDPFQISTLEHLQNMKNNLGANFILINDINAARTDTMNNGDGFEPIGNISNKFTGSFNGQFYTIDSLFIDRSSFVGLFGYIENATISNVLLTNVNISGFSNTGTIVGEDRFGVLSNISVTGRVSGNSATGGLIGRSLGAINNCFTDVSVSGSTYSGGIVGRGSTNISNSFALGNVHASNRDAGGLIALSGGVITNSYSKGSVTSAGTKGGLVGRISGENANVVNSFWDVQTSGLTSSNGGEGKTTAEMNDPFTYQHADWDIYSVWATLPDSNSGYPILRIFQDFQVSANAPVASNLYISGAIEVDSMLALAYDYSDADSDPEYIPEIQWYRSSDVAGTNRTLIEGANDTTYTITGADRAHYIGVEVIPHDLTAAGSPVMKFTPQSVASIFAGGLGTENDPFQIETIDQLQNINTGLESFYILNNDINAAVTSTWNSGAGFVPIGNNSTSFSGKFDGAGFTIDSLFIDRISEDLIGLFGVTSASSMVTNTQLTNADVKGQLRTGALVGKNNGTVMKSYSENTTIQSNDYAGVLIGENTGSVSQCYATGDIQANSAIGGLVGHNNQGHIALCYANVHVMGNTQSGGLVGLKDDGSIDQSYSIGLVDNGTSAIGGLVGEATGSSFVDSYWDSQTSGQSTSAVGAAKTTSEMNTVATFATWQLKSVWGLHPDYNSGYPFLRIFETPTPNAPVANNVTISGTIEVGNSLSVSYSYSDADNDPEYLSSIQWFRSKDTLGTDRQLIENADSISYTVQESDKAFFLSVVVTPSDVFNQGDPVEVFASQSVPSDIYAGGFGTEDFPFQIADVNQLQAMNMNLESHFVLINDIDATDTENWNNGAGFVPIAFPSSRFTGSLNGNNFKIDGLFINRPEADNVGLFSTIREGYVSNLGITNVNITADRSVGGLTGDLDGNSVTNVYVTGTVSGDSDVGGLIGSSFTETIVRDSYSTATVSGRSDVGGLVGGSYLTIINCYATGNVTSTSLYAGGLVGSNRGSISKSYATGNVNGNNTSGGLVGYNRGDIINSYSNGNVHSTFSAAGFTGTNDSTIVNSYSTGAVTSNFTPAGFISRVQSGSTVISSYWDKEASGVNIGVESGSSAGVTGATTEQMKQRATFINWDFATIWTIDEGTGYPFHQKSDFNTLAITGNEGWRMLASPVEGATLDSLLGNIRTQGFPGASVTADSSNVFLWNGTTQEWDIPSSIDQPLVNGQGVMVYVFADGDNNGTPETFPKQLSTNLPQHTGRTAANLAFSTSGSNWNFVGNPYAESIDWNAPVGWTKKGISNSFYVWSDSAGGGQGAYLTWNGITGTLPDGKIAPWQGFWVQATNEDPELVFTDSVKTSGGVYRKTEAPSKIEFTLSDGKYYSKASILILNESMASMSFDKYDALALSSLNDTTLSLATTLQDQPAMSIQAIPEALGTFGIDVNIEAKNVNSSLTLSWDASNLSGNTSFELFDSETSSNFDLNIDGSVSFDASIDSNTPSSVLNKPTTPFSYVGENSSSASRFIINVDGLALSTDDELGIPTVVELQQNYPNPFNPSTSIAFGLPQSGKVTLEVFDVLGRKVATLLNGENKNVGRHTVNFDARNLSSGMYIYRLQTGNTIISKKLTLIK